VGWCGPEAGDDATSTELMFGLVPSARGAGLAREATRAVIEHGFGLAATRRVWGAALPDNSASARVMERAGLLFEGRRVLDGAECVVYGRAAVG
jgi:ribosomal-protein-alanine N-acetyltransferase